MYMYNRYIDMYGEYHRYMLHIYTYVYTHRKDNNQSDNMVSLTISLPIKLMY